MIYPDYLQATNMVTGTVSSGETGLDGAEIIFKKGNSEKVPQPMQMVILRLNSQTEFIR